MCSATRYFQLIKVFILHHLIDTILTRPLLIILHKDKMLDILINFQLHTFLITTFRGFSFLVNNSPHLKR